LAEGFFAGKNLEPFDAALATVCFFNGRIEHALRSFPDIAARAVAFNKGDDWIVGNVELVVVVRDGSAIFGSSSPL